MRHLRVNLTALAILISLSGPTSALTLVGALAPACPVAGQAKQETPAILIALAGSVAQDLVGVAVDKVSALLKGSVLTLNSTTRVDGLFNAKVQGDKLVPEFADRCLILIVANNLVPPNEKTSGETPLPADFPYRTAQGLAATIFTLTGATSEPLLYLESEIVISSDSAAFAIQPRFGYFPKPLDQSQSWLHPYRELEIDISIKGATSSQGTSTALGWKDLADGNVAGTSVQIITPEWMAIPAIEKPEKAGVFFPATLSVKVTESNKPNGIAAAFAEALDSQKSAIQSAASQAATTALFESERARLRSTALASASKAYADYKAAYDTAVAAGGACIAEKDPASQADKCNQARLAYANFQMLQQLAQASFRDSGLTPPTPFPVLPVIPGGGK